MNIKKTATITLLALCMASPAWAKKKPPKPVIVKTAISNAGSMDSGRGCMTDTIPVNVETVVAGNHASLPTGPWSYTINGTVMLHNPNGGPMSVHVVGYIGQGDPNVDPPTDLGTFTMNGSEQQVYPYVFALGGIPAGEQRGFAVTVEFEPLLNDGASQGSCINAAYSAIEAD